MRPNGGEEATGNPASCAAFLGFFVHAATGAPFRLGIPMWWCHQCCLSPASFLGHLFYSITQTRVLRGQSSSAYRDQVSKSLSMHVLLQKQELGPDYSFQGFETKAHGSVSCPEIEQGSSSLLSVHPSWSTDLLSTPVFHACGWRPQNIVFIGWWYTAQLLLQLKCWLMLLIPTSSETRKQIEHENKVNTLHIYTLMESLSENSLLGS